MTQREQKVYNYYHSSAHNCLKFTEEPTEEAVLLKNVKELLDLLGALIVRESAATKRGVSDLIVCYRGRFVALETKDDTGVPSPLQNQFIKRVREAGGKAAVIRTVKQAFDLLLEATRA